MRPVLTPLFLSLDSISWLDEIAQTLSRQRNTPVSRSEACEYVLKGHHNKVLKRMMDQRHVEKVGPALKGTKLIRAGAR